MYKISRKEWNNLVKKYAGYGFISKSIQREEHKGKVCNIGDWMCFEGCIPGAPKNAGTSLVFEHIHFEIV